MLIAFTTFSSLTLIDTKYYCRRSKEAIRTFRMTTDNEKKYLQFVNDITDNNKVVRKVSFVVVLVILFC